MTTSVATTAKPTAFELELQQYEPQLRSALPSHIPIERFKRTFVTAINANPDLARLDRRSLFTALVKCAQDGLLPDGREAALVAFGGKATYLPMVAGYIKRMRNSGDLAAISANVVYSNDVFTLELGDEERVKHTPAIGERGKPLGAYAIAKLKSGEVQREWMSIADIEAVRKVSRASGNGPWVQWWEQMARKSVIKRLAKYLPMTADVADLIQRDDEGEQPAALAVPKTRLAVVLDDQEPVSESNAGTVPGSHQEGRAIQHDEDGVVVEHQTPPVVPVPPENGTVKAWTTYRAMLIEAAGRAPSRAWLIAFEGNNQDGLKVLEREFAPQYAMVRKAIEERAAVLAE
jgi:phage RecT family recombinase